MKAVIDDHPRVGAGSPAIRGMVGALLGLTVGLLLGIVIDLGVWLWAFGSTLADGVAREVPLLVTTAVDDDVVSATSSIGVLVIPVLLLIVGAAIGAVVGVRRGRAATG